MTEVRVGTVKIGHRIKWNGSFLTGFLGRSWYIGQIYFLAEVDKETYSAFSGKST